MHLKKATSHQMYSICENPPCTSDYYSSYFIVFLKAAMHVFKDCII